MPMYESCMNRYLKPCRRKFELFICLLDAKLKKYQESLSSPPFIKYSNTSYSLFTRKKEKKTNPLQNKPHKNTSSYHWKSFSHTDIQQYDRYIDRR